jgi:hypothetical protein
LPEPPGGTNFSEGGIYGHSNVAHVVEEEEVIDRSMSGGTIHSS